MPISESQLETWAHQGAVAQSRDTYAAVRRALDAANAGYAGMGSAIFLQGSYGNDTNVYAESDVDVVIRLDATYYHEAGQLSAAERDELNRAFVPAAYQYHDFKADVLAALRRSFGSAVTPGNKAISVAAGAGRRKADVIAAAQFRRYYSALGPLGGYPYLQVPATRYHEGICFFTAGGQQVVNFPNQHGANCTAKHEATRGWFKPTVRVVKNLRNRLVGGGVLEAGVAPSYFLEGLLYNVPSNLFWGSYAATLVRSMEWLGAADARELVCANDTYYLVNDYDPNCWPALHYRRFFDVLRRTWDAGL